MWVQICIELRRQSPSFLVEMSLLITTAYARVGDPEVFLVFPTHTSHVIVGMLGLPMCVWSTFYTDYGHLNSGPHAWVASMLSVEQPSSPLNVLKIFKTLWCVVRCVRVGNSKLWHLYGSLRTVCRHARFPSNASEIVHSGRQAWQQALFPNEPSHSPSLFPSLWRSRTIYITIKKQLPGQERCKYQQLLGEWREGKTRDMCLKQAWRSDTWLG